MDTWVWVVIIVAAVLIVGAALAAFAISTRQRRKDEQLKSEFGPEYDRTMKQMGDRKKAEKALLGRKERVEQFHLKAVSQADRERFMTEWQGVQAQFVDTPGRAIGEADELVGEAMRARGFPTGDYDQRFEDISVEHPYVVQHYREAHAIAKKNKAGQADTEALRQAMVHYRELFNELLNAPARGGAAAEEQMMRRGDERRGGGGERRTA